MACIRALVMIAYHLLSYFSIKTYVVGSIAPDKDWRQMGIYPPLFDLIGYFKF